MQERCSLSGAAWVTETLSDKPEKDTQKLNKTVEKMFKDFPPKSK